MKLENQVTGLELSQELKKVGFPQDTLFYWCKYKLVRGVYVKGFDEPKKGWRLQLGNKEGFRDDFSETVSAPTVAELGEMLPIYILKDDIVGRYDCECIKKRNDWWDILYYERNRISIMKGGKTEADARAKMWLYLKKEGLIK